MVQYSLIPVKRCKTCGNDKALEHFRRKSVSPDGRQSDCKLCSNAKLDKWRARTRERRLAYNREYYGTERGRAVVRKYQARKPAKKAAQIAVNLAVKNGRLVRPDTCETCQRKRRVEGHHDDYARQLAVRWLCRDCHKAWHRKYGEAANANLEIPPPRVTFSEIRQRKAARMSLLPAMLAGGMHKKAIAEAFGVSYWTINEEAKRVSASG